MHALYGGVPSGLWVQFGWFGDAVGDRVAPFITYARDNRYVAWNSPDSATYIALNPLTTYHIELRVNGRIWLLTARTLDGAWSDQIAGTLPTHHTAYRYIALFSPDNEDSPECQDTLEDLKIVRGS